MAEQRRKCLQARQYLGEVSALCFLHLPRHLSSSPYLLAGMGSQMILYDLKVGSMIKSFHVFEGIRVHGIAACLTDHIEGSLYAMLAFKIAVFGERRVKLFNLNIEMEFLIQNQPKVCLDLVLLHLLPQFSQWVLDASFLKGCSFLTVGCSDNSVHFWDIQRAHVILESQCPERCLLYSMRLWGEELEALRIASGTIYNEIIVWKLVRQDCPASSKDQDDLHDQQYSAVRMCVLVGHEGSIFRIAWSSDGSMLVSASDDRCARIWTISIKDETSNLVEGNNCGSLGHVLFGHNARVWDCSILHPLIITAGEDCTCRVWGLDGKQVKMIKEHIGRGVWRCLYDPFSSLLVTAGFDSAIKVHHLHAPIRSLEQRDVVVKDFDDGTVMFTAHIPNLSTHAGLMDSKSEYVRCLHFGCEDVLYVATNHGYLYHAKLSNSGTVNWTELVEVGQAVPIICMDLLFGNLSNFSSQIEDWIAVGDGEGRVTIVTAGADVSNSNVSLMFSWPAELKRRLLGTYWCKSLGNRYVFTVDPRGILKLWRLSVSIHSASGNSVKSFNASLIAEFQSCFGMRIMCLDASFDDELLVCGDLRGNVILFPLLKNTLLGAINSSELRIPPLTYFRGVHGISTVSSISIAGFRSDQIDICSTGGDGCICNMEYYKDGNNLNFIALKQVKELSLIESISAHINSVDGLASGNYAIGFASADFIIWNLATETKVVKVSCGGWRRPHAYYLGNVAEMKNCFAYVKDGVINIHRQWIPGIARRIYPRNLNMQFHGREIHCLCFVTRDMNAGEDGFHNSGSMFISTGCEDGTVRLTRYTLDVGNWSASRLLGEHVGGSAVRSICRVSKTHTVSVNVTMMHNGSYRPIDDLDNAENPFLLISVGAKRVLTCWLLGENKVNKKEPLIDCPNSGTGDFSSMNFTWLSTDIPTKYSITKTSATEKIAGPASSASLNPDIKEAGLKSSGKDICENDWRYLAVTAFLVRDASSRSSVCFVVVACSDATLALRALVLPCRLWFNIAVLLPLSSPVLALQHVIVPFHVPSGDCVWTESVFIVISGSTDGCIQFWDLTATIRAFMQQLSTFCHLHESGNFLRRPRTGRGSQGGRLWRFKRNPLPGEAANESDKHHNSATASPQVDLEENDNSFSSETHEMERHEIEPMFIQGNVHQSGVNCLHVSVTGNGEGLGMCSRYVVLSGGDDQSLCCIGFELALGPTVGEREASNFTSFCLDSRFGFLYCKCIASAHSSAVKGVWTDGKWVFSTGLDQRVRCWKLKDGGKLVERDHLIVSVPEPEALDAQPFGCNDYLIVVAGRGMQMVVFSVA